MPNGNWILGDLFTKDYGHNGSIAKLWENRWKMPCQRSVYPFHDGSFADFEPIFAHLIAADINDPYTDAYTNAFLPTARALVQKAQELSHLGASSKIEHKEEAKLLFFRANALFRLARFPYIGTELKCRVFEEQKSAYLQGAQLWDVPIEEVIIPHVHAANGDGERIPLYVRHPKGDGPFPTVLLITGLDGHRPDNTERTEEHLRRGWATVICDIPGTTVDCPANKLDPLSPDRLFTSILEYIKQAPQLDETHVIAWGLSAGGYYAIRLAHTHRSKLIGSVGHGAGTHHYIGREWLGQIAKHEYPFGLERAYCQKYGYDDFETMKERCQDEFSLVSGKGEGVAVVGQGLPSCRLLLVNGTLDGCMPVEDSMLLAEYGSPKEMRFIKDRLHMGYPEANATVFPWLEEVMATTVG
ncbi:pigment biosynthesis protein Ayg1 [Boeremia exigua]|uniref:pigment biosynthesis protein Ayg1 n=1 Tax=Boeremia exigua TaxID=749465 RepID=UPI001E8DEED0|nr:pigment biosynthesis protein Ayg1 [Boeremia exigua]KAH6629237.1 pigment biosynthesis protein Ayg1 [Boeremia exigua]